MCEIDLICVAKPVGRNTALRRFRRTRGVRQCRKLPLGLDQWYNGTDVNLSWGCYRGNY